MKISRNCLLLLGSVFIFHSGNGQSAYDSSAKDVVSLFYHDMADYALLYNGTEYANFDPIAKGHPFYISDEAADGQLVYNDILYKNVPLLYDIEYDMLITRRYNNGVMMKLISEKVKTFTISSHSFIYVMADSTNGGSIGDGFYELLYDGSTRVLAKHHKKIFEPSNLERTYLEATNYFVLIDKKYHEVNNQGTMMRIFKNNRDLKKYIRSNDLKFKRQPALTLAKAAAFYDQLKK